MKAKDAPPNALSLERRPSQGSMKAPCELKKMPFILNNDALIIQQGIKPHEIFFYIICDFLICNGGIPEAPQSLSALMPAVASGISRVGRLMR